MRTHIVYHVLHDVYLWYAVVRSIITSYVYIPDHVKPGPRGPNLDSRNRPRPLPHAVQSALMIQEGIRNRTEPAEPNRTD